MTSTPKDDRHLVLKSLDRLEEIAGPARISLFQTRLEESYDIDEDALYSAWKVLKLKSDEIAKAIKEEAIPKSTYDGDLCPIIDKILVYPEITRKGARGKKKVSLPRHMTSNSALEILELQDKGKRRKELLKEARRLKKEKKGKENAPVLENDKENEVGRQGEMGIKIRKNKKSHKNEENDKKNRKRNQNGKNKEEDIEDESRINQTVQN